MPNLLLVMLGGAIGAGARYGVGQFAVARLAGPLAGTLIVNLLGGLLMGVLAGALAGRASPGGPLWLFLGVGVIGGFTTFSAFGLDAVMLIERGAPLAATAYVATSVLGAMGLFAAGLAVAQQLA